MNDKKTSDKEGQFHLGYTCKFISVQGPLIILGTGTAYFVLLAEWWYIFLDSPIFPL